MAWATPTVEISFSTNPTAAPVWVDVTAYVVGDITITRGRDRETEAMQPGECSFTLVNTDRRFDPSNSSGPYYGQLKFRRRVRVGTTISSTYYPQFNGYVQGWPQTYDHVNNMGYVEVTALDALSVLSTTPITGGPWFDLVKADSPMAWYRLAEAEGIATDSSGQNRHGAYQSVTKAEDGLRYPTDHPTTASYFGLGSYVDIGYPYTSGPPPSATQAVECWVKANGDGAVGGQIVGQFEWAGTSTSLWHSNFLLALNDIPSLGRRGAVLVYLQGIAGSYVGERSITDGAWHHIVVYKSTTTLNIYVDGVLDKSQAVAGRWFEQPNSGSYANWYQFIIGAEDQSTSAYAHSQLNATLTDVVFYSGTVFDATKVAARYAAGRGWVDDTVSTRAGRVLDKAGWPSADRAIGTSVVRVPPQGTWEGDALALLQQLAQAEDAPLYVSKAGLLTMKARYDRLGLTSTAWSDATGSSLPFEAVETSFDEATAYNSVVTARQDSDATFTKEDASSVAEYYRRSLERTDLYVLSDWDAKQLGEEWLYYYTRGQPRMPLFRVNARATATALLAVLNTELGSRFQITSKPLNTGSESVHDQVIERIALTWSPSSLILAAEYVGSSYSNRSIFKLGTGNSTIGSSGGSAAVIA